MSPPILCAVVKRKGTKYGLAGDAAEFENEHYDASESWNATPPSFSLPLLPLPLPSSIVPDIHPPIGLPSDFCIFIIYGMLSSFTYTVLSFLMIY